MDPKAFLESLDPSQRALVLNKLKARGYDVKKLLGDGQVFYAALEAALGKDNAAVLLAAAKAKSLIDAAGRALDQGLEGFLRFAEGVEEKALEALGAGHLLSAYRGLGCPDRLAKAKALAKALAGKLQPAKLGEVEAQIWQLMTQECTVLSHLGGVVAVTEY